MKKKKKKIIKKNIYPKVPQYLDRNESRTGDYTARNERRAGKF